MLIQAAVAVATVAAVWVALRTATNDARWRADRERREALSVWPIVTTELGELERLLASLIVDLEGLREPRPGLDAPARGLQVKPYKRGSVAIFESMNATVELLALPSCWKLVDKLGILPSRAGEDVALVMANIPLLANSARQLTQWRHGTAEYAKEIEHVWGLSSILRDIVKSLITKPIHELAPPSARP